MSRTSSKALDRASRDALEVEVLAGVEDITDAANRLNQLLLERVVHLGPQPAHHHIDDVGSRLEINVPDLLDNFRARYDLARRMRHVEEQGEFLGRQI